MESISRGTINPLLHSHYMASLLDNPSTTVIINNKLLIVAIWFSYGQHLSSPPAKIKDVEAAVALIPTCSALNNLDFSISHILGTAPHTILYLFNLQSQIRKTSISRLELVVRKMLLPLPPLYIKIFHFLMTLASDLGLLLELRYLTKYTPALF